MSVLIAVVLFIIALILLWVKLISKMPEVRIWMKLDEAETAEKLADSVEEVDTKKAKENKTKLDKFKEGTYL